MEKLTVTVSGKQGSGKTTLIRQLQQLLIEAGAEQVVVDDKFEISYDGASIKFIEKQTKK